MRRANFGIALLLTLAGALDSTSQAQAQTRDLDHWLSFKTTHFQLYSESDIITSRATLKHLESFRAVLERFSPDLKLVSPAPTRIFLFDSVASYEPYKTVSQQGVNILGQFVHHPNGNYLTMQVGNNPLGALAVGSHEYVHFLVQTNFPSAPTWFDEGLAEYYSTFAIEEKVAIVGRPVARHLQKLIGPAHLELDALLRGDNPFVDQEDGDQTERNYALSWALVHYLLSTESDMSNQLIEVLAGLGGQAQPSDPAETLENAITRGRQRLEDQLAAYLTRAYFPVRKIPLQRLELSEDAPLERISPAELRTQLGLLARHTGHTEAAVSHFEAALEFDPELSEALAALATMGSSSAITQ